MTLIPAPTTMPVNREEWVKELGLSNFINTYYQYKDLQSLRGVNKILIIGLGNGFDAHVFRWRGYSVTTFDIDPVFKPDVLGSINDLSMFKNNSFDVVIASHVLEHLAAPHLNDSLAELARIANYSIIYLPVAGRHLQFRFKMDSKGVDLSFIFDLFNYFHKPDGITPRYRAGQHYWEVGMRGFTTKQLTQRFSKYFNIISQYRNKDWYPSYNYIMESKTHAKK